MNFNTMFEDDIKEEIQERFEDNPREYVARLILDNSITNDEMVLVLLKAMSLEDIKQALDANELSPRFI